MPEPERCLTRQITLPLGTWVRADAAARLMGVTRNVWVGAAIDVVVGYLMESVDDVTPRDGGFLAPDERSPGRGKPVAAWKSKESK